MSVLNYSGLQYFYDNLVAKFADARALATLQNQTNDISDLLDTLNDLFTAWKEENFSVSNSETFFEGISKNIKITSEKNSSLSIYLVGTNTSATANSSYDLHSFYSNAFLQQSVSGTASTQGTTTLVLGNSSTTASTYDFQGQIKLFGPSSSAVTLSYEDSSASYVSLPKGGTSSAPAVLALKSEVTDVVNNVNTITGTTVPALQNSIKENADAIDLINGTLTSVPTTYATKTELSNEISKLLGNAPEESLKTLEALADALNDDENFATTVNNAIAERVLTTTYNAKMTELDASIKEL